MIVTQKYFAICVSAGEYLTIVSEIEVSSITWDRDFFWKMWEEYYTLRGFRSRYLRSFLIKPVDVKYVKVRITMIFLLSLRRSDTSSSLLLIMAHNINEQ